MDCHDLHDCWQQTVNRNHIRERERERLKELERVYSNWTEGWYNKREILILNHSGGVWELNTADSLLTRHCNTQLMLLVFLLLLNSHCISALWQPLLCNLHPNKASWIQPYWAESTRGRNRDRKSTGLKLICHSPLSACVPLLRLFELYIPLFSWFLCPAT